MPWSCGCRFPCWCGCGTGRDVYSRPEPVWRKPCGCGYAARNRTAGGDGYICRRRPGFAATPAPVMGTAAARRGWSFVWKDFCCFPAPPCLQRLPVRQTRGHGIRSFQNKGKHVSGGTILCGQKNDPPVFPFQESRKDIYNYCAYQQCAPGRKRNGNASLPPFWGAL